MQFDEDQHDHIIKSGDGPAAVKKAVCNNHTVTFQASGFVSNLVEIKVWPSSTQTMRESDGKSYLYFEGKAKFTIGGITFQIQGRLHKDFINSYIDHHPHKLKITK